MVAGTCWKMCLLRFEKVTCRASGTVSKLRGVSISCSRVSTLSDLALVQVATCLLIGEKSCTHFSTMSDTPFRAKPRWNRQASYE